MTQQLVPFAVWSRRSPVGTGHGSGTGSAMLAELVAHSGETAAQAAVVKHLVPFGANSGLSRAGVAHGLGPSGTILAELAANAIAAAGTSEVQSYDPPRVVHAADPGEVTETVKAFEALYADAVRLLNEGQTAAAFDLVYDAFEDALLRRAFFDANLGCLAALRSPTPIPLKLLVGILTVTLPWRRLLPARGSVAARATSVARRDHGPERARRILHGLF